MLKGGCLLTVAVLMAATSCTRTLYVPVESVRTEYKNTVQRDSIHFYDSIYVKDKGDTVWIERYNRLYVDRFLRDTVELRDTVRVPYPVDVVKEVKEYRLRWHESVLIYAGLLAILAWGGISNQAANQGSCLKLPCGERRLLMGASLALQLLIVNAVEYGKGDAQVQNGKSKGQTARREEQTASWS
jgi:hypothetical protein